MTQLSDFPPDVQRAARNAYDAYRYGGDYGLLEAIALAISTDRRARASAQPARRIGLTAHQKRVMDYLTAFIAEHGISPSFEDIRVHFGLASKSGVHRVITELEERGAIQRLPNRARAITIIATPNIGA